jgi:hypothetical protein
MATINLKFGAEDFSSLCVNDYVYYVNTTQAGAYKVNNNTAKLLGPVKQFSKAIPTVTKFFNIDEEHYRQFTLSSNIVQNSILNQARSNYTTNISDASVAAMNSAGFLTADFGDGTQNTIKIGDTFENVIINGTNVISTLSSFIKIGGYLGFQFSSNISNTDSIGLNFRINGPNYKKLFTGFTSGISVGMFASGTNLPVIEGTTTPTLTVSSVVENVSITLSGPARTINSSAEQITFSHDNTVTTKPFEVLVHVPNQDITPPHNSNNPYYFFVKDTSVNTSGLLGYYAEVKLSNNSTSKAELFSIGTEIFESSK